MKSNFQVYKNGYKVYSVDMMIAYINIFDPTAIKLTIEELSHNLLEDYWNHNGKDYSPAEFLASIKRDGYNKSEYQNDIERIKRLLDYPIIVHGKNKDIVDGLHRLCKAILNDNSTIHAYVFDKKLMKKFKLSNSDVNYIFDKGKLLTYRLIELFHERFMK